MQKKSIFEFRNFLKMTFKQIFSIMLIGLSCFLTQTKAQSSFENQSYKELYRPQFHFSPQKSWMNDPNGLVFYQGKYHLFYQYYPDNIIWGPMHWGHATSRDLIHWQHQEVALFPDKNGYIFSGSAAIDFNNSSQLGSKKNPAMIAIFTYHDMDGERANSTNFQTQGLAYSLDGGQNWIKHPQNPIIKNEGLKDFRDPKVFWNAKTNQWNLVLVAGDHAVFYSSKNLLEWQKESEFRKNIGAHGGVWECPDLFPLIDKKTGEKKWILLVSINPGAPNGGSGTQYFVGDFDGKTFSTTQKDIKWVDYGTDNYAGITYNNAPNNERIFIGWMSNWQYAQKTPTQVWRSAMTLPRKLDLVKINDEFLLKSYPVAQLAKISKTIFTKDNINLQKKHPFILKNDALNQSEIEFTTASKSLKIVFSNTQNDSLVVTYNSQEKTIDVDRSQSGITDFDADFKNKKYNVKLPLLNAKKITYNFFLDWSSMELFLNKGEYVFTGQLFPRTPYNQIKISTDDNQMISQFRLSKIKSIW